MIKIIEYTNEELYDRNFKKHCYRCGMDYTEPPAFSRHTIPRNIPICSECGSIEAGKDMQILEECISRWKISSKWRLG